MSVTREEVIRGLNDIHAVACGLGDDECYLNSIGIKQLQTLINDATALLEASEPVEPIRMNHDENKYRDHYRCPICDDDLTYEQKYCAECGRAVKWP